MNAPEGNRRRAPAVGVSSIAGLAGSIDSGGEARNGGNVPLRAAERVLVRAPNWLGDTVMAVPALRALRAALPRARIIVAGRWAALLAGQGVADVALSYPSSFAERRRFNRALGADGADLAVVFPNSLESAVAARQWRAARRIGFDTDGRGPLLTDAIALPRPRQHQIDEYLTLLADLAPSAVDPTPVWRRAGDGERAREVDALVAEAGVGPGERIVGLHLGASFGPSKLWAAESFARLAERLADRRLVPLLLGGAADRDTALRVVSMARRPPASLVGRDRLALLPHLLERLACLVSGDTGIAHLAAALGVPTVTLFGPTDPGLSAPRAPAARVLWRGAPCAPCFLTSCPIEHACMREIAVDDVERVVHQVTA
jgi:heptosyltransferase-2